MHLKFTIPSRYRLQRKKLDVLFRKFEEYCNPRRNITSERHKFFTCVQQPTENIDQYVTELRTRASKCEFGELCERLIRDRIACGISCNTLREKQLQETDLELQKVIDMCRASEFSKRQTKSITEEPKNVDYVNKKAAPRKFPPKAHGKKKTGPTSACKRCGTVHGPRECPAFGKICQKCKNRNHFASQCLSKNVHLASGMSNWTIQVPFSQPLTPPLAASSLIVCHLVLTPLMKYFRRKCSLPLKELKEQKLSMMTSWFGARMKKAMTEHSEMSSKELEKRV